MAFYQCCRAMRVHFIALEGIKRFVWGTKLLQTAVLTSPVDFISLCPNTEATALLFKSECKGSLPDIYAQLPQGARHPRGESGYIRQHTYTIACNTTNVLHFLNSALLNLPSPTRICFAYIVGDTTYDCGFII